MLVVRLLRPVVWSPDSPEEEEEEEEEANMEDLKLEVDEMNFSGAEAKGAPLPERSVIQSLQASSELCSTLKFSWCGARARSLVVLDFLLQSA